MRVFAFLAFLLATGGSAGFASAHDYHEGCGASDWSTDDTRLPPLSINANLWLGSECLGATVTLVDVKCPVAHVHPVYDVHAPLLTGDDCQGGALVACHPRWLRGSLCEDVLA